MRLAAPPMLGELDPSIVGLTQMVLEALAVLPGRPDEHASLYKTVWVWADNDTDAIAEVVRGWRGRSGRIIQ